MSTVPDDANPTVAAMAIAWELTNRAYQGTKMVDPEDATARLLGIYETAFDRIMNALPEKTAKARSRQG